MVVISDAWIKRTFTGKEVGVRISKMSDANKVRENVGIPKELGVG